MPIALSSDGPLNVKRTLGSLVPHPAAIGKIMGAKTGITAPRVHLAGGGIANAENLESNMFQPVLPNGSVPVADINFITDPQLSNGPGPGQSKANSTPKQQQNSLQQMAELGQAGSSINSLVGAGNSGINGISNFFGSGLGGVASGPDAATSNSVLDSSNGFAPGTSLESLMPDAAGASTSGANITGGIVGDSGAAGAADAGAEAAADAGAEAAGSGAIDSVAEFLPFLAAAAKKGGAIPHRDDGGDVSSSMTNMLMRREAGETYHPSGLLNSAGPGRTDTINTNVPSGAYVVPADVTSGLGEGNTLAGSAVIDRMFSTAPHGVAKPKIGHGEGPPRAPSSRPESPPTGVQGGPTVNTSFINNAGGYAKGGKADDKAPVVVAGGEYVIHPQQIIAKFGSLKRGHKILDHWVVMERQRIAKEMLKLANPVGSKVKLK
jgi:hypothetical protein